MPFHSNARARWGGQSGAGQIIHFCFSARKEPVKFWSFRYAFINAHQLRGPFCRIKGLIMLRNTLSRPTGEEEKINVMLLESLDELDGITSKLQWVIEDLGPNESERQ